MSYRLSVSRSVSKSLGRLPADVYSRVDSTILSLAGEPHPPGCAKLKGREEWRLRVGSYRIVYSIDEARQVIEILRVAHRRDVYRQG